MWRFESVYRPEENEIALCAMKSERGSDEIFGIPPQMKSKPAALDKLNPLSSPREAGFHREAISSTAGGFLTPSADLAIKKPFAFANGFFMCRVADLDARRFCRGDNIPLVMIGAKSIRVLPGF